MKKKLNVVFYILIALFVILSLIIYNEFKSRQMANAALDQLMQQNTEIKNLDFNAMGRYGAFVKDFEESYLKLEKDMDNLDSDLKKFDNLNFFDKKYLDNPEEGKKESKLFNDVYSKLNTTLTEDFNQVKRSFEKVPASTKEKEKLKKILDDDTAELVKSMEPFGSSLKNYTTKIDAMYDFLISRKGKYVTKGNNLSFYSQQDVDKYNQLVTDIKAAAEQVK